VRGNFEYVHTRSIGEATRHLADAEGRAAILAGGTDLLVNVRNGLASPALLVDIKGIETLDRLEVSENSRTAVIGASVPLNRIAENAAIRRLFPALGEAALSIATYQLRNRATLVGNLCNASPASDSLPPLLVLGAQLHVQGEEGEREIPLCAFCTGVKQTCLRADEIVTEVRVPRLEDGARTGFIKQQRIRGHDLAVVNVAAAFLPGDRMLRIAIGSCGPTPTLLEPIDLGSHSPETLAEEAVRSAKAAVSPISDVRASATYRSAVLPILIHRLVERLLAEEGAL
jgi:CO/xanthine dehydrogenase FAD-binding subunit